MSRVIFVLHVCRETKVNMYIPIQKKYHQTIGNQSLITAIFVVFYVVTKNQKLIITRKIIKLTLVILK